jgi:hypothetical protein
MATGPFYRGGPRLHARRLDVKFDRNGLVKNIRGVSVYDRPDHPNLKRHGDVHLVTQLPESLRLIQHGFDLSHHEIAPVVEMTFEEYEAELGKAVLVPISGLIEGESFDEQ